MYKSICILQTIYYRHFFSFQLLKLSLLQSDIDMALLWRLIHLRAKSIIIWYTPQPFPHCIHTSSLAYPAIWRKTVHWDLSINVHVAASDGDAAPTTTTNDTIYHFITVLFISKVQVVWKTRNAQTLV